MKSESSKSYFHLGKTDLWAILLLGLAFYFTPCPKPSFNPFDDQFNVLFEDVVREKCDTIIGSCGVFALAKKIDNITFYYQFYERDYSGGKGLILDLDTIIYSTDSLQNEAYQTIYKKTINYNFINKKLAPFKLKLHKVEKREDSDYITIFFKSLDNKIIRGDVGAEELENKKGLLIKRLDIFRPNKNQSKTIRELFYEFMDYFKEKRDPNMIYVD